MTAPAESRASPGPPAGGWTTTAAGRRALEVVREQGLRSLGWKLLGETVYRRAWLYEWRLGAPVAEPPAPPGITLEELDPDEVERPAGPRLGADPRRVRERLAAGHRCFLARDGDEVVHSAWVALGRARIDYLDRELLLGAREGYLYEVVTAPAARGRGLSRLVARRIGATLGRAGVARLWAVVMPENRAGVGALPSWGYRRVGRLATIRIGRRRLALGRLEARDGVGADEWGRALRRIEESPYLDPFLGELKRRTHLDLLGRWGRLRRDGRLLKTDLFEEAAGPDAFLAELTGEVARAVGMDVSLAVVQRARQRVRGRAGEPPAAGWVVADARRLPFAAGAFATVVSTSTLDHFPDPADLGVSLLELRRVLESRGRLVITLDNRQNLLDPLLRVARRLRLVPFFLGRSYRASELRGELERAGFEVGGTTAILHNPRLLAVGAVRLARALRVRALGAAVERALVAAQRLEGTRWRYRTGSFVAAVATPARDPR